MAGEFIQGNEQGLPGEEFSGEGFPGEAFSGEDFQAVRYAAPARVGNIAVKDKYLDTRDLKLMLAEESSIMT